MTVDRSTRLAPRALACYHRPQTLEHEMVALTAAVAHVRRLADEALDRPQGVAINFRLAVYDTMERCNTAARSFQVTFSALRNRDRKQRQVKMKDKHLLDDEVVGLYDRLSCTKILSEDEQGYSVHLIPDVALVFDQDVTDRATGERLEQFTPEARRLRRVVVLLNEEYTRAREQKRQPHNPLTADDREWVIANHLISAQEFWPHLFPRDETPVVKVDPFLTLEDNFSFGDDEPT